MVIWGYLTVDQNQKIKSLELALRQSQETIKHYQLAKENTERLKEEKHTLALQLARFESFKEEYNIVLGESMALKEEKENFLRMLGGVAPTEVLKTLSEQRRMIESLNEKLGNETAYRESVQNDIRSLEEAPRKMEQEKSDTLKLVDESNKQLKLVEKSKVLLSKEINFLRDHVRSYDQERDFVSASDKAVNDRIAFLESLVDEYKQKIEHAYHSEANQSRIQSLTLELESLRSEREALRSELVELQDRIADYENKLGSGHYNPNTTRILQLMSNPEHEEFAIRKTLLDSLKNENAALRGSFTSTIPIESYNTLQIEYVNTQNLVAEKEKKIDRLKSIFQQTALEFREAVLGLLGYQVQVAPNVVRLSSGNLEIVYDRLSGQLTVDDSLKHLANELDLPGFFAACILHQRGVNLN
jgi:mitotic spindle assembly checkpoint protein MAD1